MPWTAPLTFVSGAALTAAQMNTHLRNNFQELAPAHATLAGQFFVADGANKLRSRMIKNAVTTDEAFLKNTEYSSGPVGPEVTMYTGKHVIALWAFAGGNDTVDDSAVYGSLIVSGESDIELGDAHSAIYDGQPQDNNMRNLQMHFFHGDTELTPGENTFSMVYRVREGAGRFFDRELIVIPF